MPHLASLVIALSKIVPLLNRLLDEVQRARTNSTHNAIDKAIEQARQAPPVCPYLACPLRVSNAGKRAEIP